MTTTNSLVVSTVISLVLSLVVALVASMIYNAIMPVGSVELDSVLFCIVFGTVVSVIAGYLMARKANSVFGMVNGDILGATNELSRPFIMLVMILPYVCWLG